MVNDAIRLEIAVLLEKLLVNTYHARAWIQIETILEKLIQQFDSSEINQDEFIDDNLQALRELITSNISENISPKGTRGARPQSPPTRPISINYRNLVNHMISESRLILKTIEKKIPNK